MAAPGAEGHCWAQDTQKAQTQSGPHTVAARRGTEALRLRLLPSATQHESGAGSYTLMPQHPQLKWGS